jgi:hypothetical protein
MAAPALARGHATPTPSPTPVPPADPAITALARRAFVLEQAGIIDEKIITPSLKARMTPEVVGHNAQLLAAAGALKSMTYLGPISTITGPLPAGVQPYLYKMICANGIMYEQIDVVGGKIAGEQFSDTLATPTP